MGELLTNGSELQSFGKWMFQQVLTLMCGRFGASPCWEMRWGRTEIWRSCKEDVYLWKVNWEMQAALYFEYTVQCNVIEVYCTVGFRNVGSSTFILIFFFYFSLAVHTESETAPQGDLWPGKVMLRNIFTWTASSAPVSAAARLSSDEPHEARNAESR